MGPTDSCTMLYNPMSHGAHTSLYNPMAHGAHALLYNPMTHGDLYPLYNVVWPHDPWGFVTIAAPMTHGEKVAEGAQPCTCRVCGILVWDHLTWLRKYQTEAAATAGSCEAVVIMSGAWKT